MTVNLATELARQGYDSHLVLASARGSILEDVPPNVRVVDLGVATTFRALPRLRKYLLSARPATLISSKTHANVVCLAARLLARVDTKVAVCEHSTFQFRRQTSARDRIAFELARSLYGRADRIIAVSPDVAGVCCENLGLDPSLVRIVPNPVITPLARQLVNERGGHDWLNDGPYVYLAAGRLVPEKGFALLIRAFATVSQQFESRLLILGDGPLRPDLEVLIQELGLSDLVELVGNVANPFPYMRDSDAFVLSSVTEGFPLVLVEALFAGTKIIATECSSSVGEILEHGRLGTLVPAGDAAKLAQAMLRTAANERLPQSVTRTRAEEYSVERVARRYLQLLEMT